VWATGRIRLEPAGGPNKLELKIRCGAGMKSARRRQEGVGDMLKEASLIVPTLALVVSTIVSPTVAGVIETDGYRVISARSEAGPVGHTNVDDPADIEDFSFPPPETTFDEALMTFVVGSVGRTSASGDGSQNTTLANGHYFGTLITAATADNNGGDWADGYGQSELTVCFDLDAAADVHFVGSYEVLEEGVGASAMVQALLLGNVQQIIVEETSTGSGDHDFWWALEPGSYIIDMTISSSANQIFNDGLSIVSAEYEFEITVDTGDECPADFDGDGDVDTADLLYLLAAWGTPDGDIDGDGDTDTADLLALLAAWGECP
jgi:hypothetical protein